jgi:hypothetical protein
MAILFKESKVTFMLLLICIILKGRYIIYSIKHIIIIFFLLSKQHFNFIEPSYQKNIRCGKFIKIGTLETDLHLP